MVNESWGCNISPWRRSKLSCYKIGESPKFCAPHMPTNPQHIPCIWDMSCPHIELWMIFDPNNQKYRGLWGCWWAAAYRLMFLYFSLSNFFLRHRSLLILSRICKHSKICNRNFLVRFWVKCNLSLLVFYSYDFAVSCVS